MKALVLTESEVAALLPIPELIDEIERALVAFSSDQVRQPVRSTIEAGPEGSWFAVMPASTSDPPALGAKLVTVFPANAARGRPTHSALIVLFDPETGETRAILGAGAITAARTAAASAVSVRHLARQDAHVLAILGSGVQARSHFEALQHVRAFDEVRAWSPTSEHLARFCSTTGARPASSAEDAVRGASVIVLATSSRTPVIESDWVSRGAHVISLGAYTPGAREMDPPLMVRGRLFVDSREAALRESGDIVQAIREGRIQPAHIAAELGEVACGRVTGRMIAAEITIFKSLGLAAEDLAAARLAWRCATVAGKGREIDL